MIPCAYFFVDEKLERYETYSSTLSEYFTRDEIFNFDENEHAMLQNAALVVDYFLSFQYAFVVYNPNEKHMLLANIGDTDTIKMIVDTQQKADMLENYCYTITGLSMLFEKADDLQSYDLNYLINHNKDAYKNSIQNCENGINAYIDNVTNMMDLCLEDFRNEFLF